jgi:uncharacterized protein (DUF952 family)
MASETTDRLFKIALASECESFKTDGKVCSSLDAADGFVHLSDRNQTPNVAGKNLVSQAR